MRVHDDKVYTNKFFSNPQGVFNATGWTPSQKTGNESELLEKGYQRDINEELGVMYGN